MNPAPTAPTHWGGFALDRFQQEAIAALAAGRSVLVCAPTGTGKTVIADWIVDEALRTGRRVVYTAPVKALSNQKYRGWAAHYGVDRVGLITGDLVIRRDAPLLVMTTEILRNMLLQDDAPADLLAVVLDEIHFLDDRERGTVWEEVLIYLPKEVRVVGLSATLSNVSDFATWLSSVRGEQVAVVTETERAVPLKVSYCSRETGLVDPDIFANRIRSHSSGSSGSDRGRGRGRGHSRGTSHIDVIAALDDRDLLPCLYFSFSRRDCEGLARALARRPPNFWLTDEEVAAVDAAMADPDVADVVDQNLAETLRLGIAWHHAGLHVRLKQLVEQLYERRLIRVLYCTSTFALGVNMPARSVVFHGLFKFDGRAVAPLTTRQFMQKAGRAGRRGLDDVGHVVVRIDADEWDRVAPVLERLRQARPEPVRSGFNLSFSSVTRLLQRHGFERAREVVDRSFLAWHLGRKAAADTAAARLAARPKDQKRLEHRATESVDRCWNEFQEKVHFLRGIGYLDEEFAFNAGANVLLHLQMSEILVAELFLQGLLDELPPHVLFGLCCALVSDLPRNAHRRSRTTREEKQLAGRIRAIVETPAVEEAARLTNTPTTFDPNLIPFGVGWARGVPLAALMEDLECETDVSGDIVGAFRRAKDLVGQLARVWEHDPSRRDEMRALMRTVDRDEVEVIA